MAVAVLSITRCPFCLDFDSDAEIRGCTRCNAFAERLRETLPPSVSVIDYLSEFYSEKRHALRVWP